MTIVVQCLLAFFILAVLGFVAAMPVFATVWLVWRVTHKPDAQPAVRAG